jgi:hypothetical protein
MVPKSSLSGAMYSALPSAGCEARYQEPRTGVVANPEVRTATTAGLGSTFEAQRFSELDGSHARAQELAGLAAELRSYAKRDAMSRRQSAHLEISSILVPDKQAFRPSGRPRWRGVGRRSGGRVGALALTSIWFRHALTRLVESGHGAKWAQRTMGQRGVSSSLRRRWWAVTARPQADRRG